MAKVKDLAVKIGESNGKAIWKNVGAIIEGQNGPYIVLEKTFNPAGLDGRNGSIIISMFEPRQRQQSSAAKEMGFDDSWPQNDEPIPF